MAQNNRLGVVPVSVQMDDAFLVPSQSLFQKGVSNVERV